jgi:chromate transport protein ChrA
MVTSERMLRLIIEIIFVLLGGLVGWLGWTGHIFFDRRKISWVVLSSALILWGLRALYKPNKSWTRWENWTRGLSLTMLGLVMLAISRVPFSWVGPLLAAGGALLMLRGIIGSALILRPR